jgi:hypothetical protein
MAGSRERAREPKEGDDRWGRDVNERERERGRGRAARVAGPRGRVRVRACEQAARLGRAGGEDGKRPDRQFCFSFLKM